MLTEFERMLFILLAVLSLGAAYAGFVDMARIIARGSGGLRRDNLLRRAWQALTIYLTQRTSLKTRRVTSLIHWGVVIGFTWYFVVNALDMLLGFAPGFEAALWSLGGVYDGLRLVGDLLSALVILGVIYFALRRLSSRGRRTLGFGDNVLLHPNARDGGIMRDSFIVISFILLHVGARLLGESVAVAQHGSDSFMPVATAIAPIWAGLNADALDIARRLCWWIALGGIFVFLPYFPQSKHAHLFMAPFNFLTKPKRESLGELRPLDFEDETIEQFGAAQLTDLHQSQIVDAFACIMCNRCQDVCPAYVTGKELSPAALEINKRFGIKQHWDALASGGEADFALAGEVISESALWACTACGACIDICPVGNEPMMDIFDIRRDAVLMKSDFPSELQGAFNGMERQGNPWQIAERRTGWTADLDFAVPTIAEKPDAEILYWTGCAVSYDPRAQKTAQALVKLLNAAGASYAILGEDESCSGDVARRAGNEYLYQEMAAENVATLNAIKPKRIVVTCPHCFHNIGKEYHQFGGDYEVVHHTELIAELMEAGALPKSANPASFSNVTFHDPCYLGRHNDVVEAPRDALRGSGAPLVEMPRSKKNSFCCGAGGAQFWKEEEAGETKVSLERYREAAATGAEALAVGCPFCMRMFEDASQELGEGPVVLDIAEIVAGGL